jgi:hypothetical protein
VIHLQRRPFPEMRARTAPQFNRLNCPGPSLSGPFSVPCARSGCGVARPARLRLALSLASGPEACGTGSVACGLCGLPVQPVELGCGLDLPGWVLSPCRRPTAPSTWSSPGRRRRFSRSAAACSSRWTVDCWAGDVPGSSISPWRAKASILEAASVQPVELAVLSAEAIDSDSGW